jgi:hypothetical protein
MEEKMKGKTNNTKVKKIWLEVLGNKGSKRLKDSRNGKESRKRREGRKHQGQVKEKEKRRQVTR